LANQKVLVAVGGDAVGATGELTRMVLLVLLSAAA